MRLILLSVLLLLFVTDTYERGTRKENPQGGGSKKGAKGGSRQGGMTGGNNNQGGKQTGGMFDPKKRSREANQPKCNPEEAVKCIKPLTENFGKACKNEYAQLTQMAPEVSREYKISENDEEGESKNKPVRGGPIGGNNDKWGNQGGGGGGWGGGGRGGGNSGGGWGGGGRGGGNSGGGWGGGGRGGGNSGGGWGGGGRGGSSSGGGGWGGSSGWGRGRRSLPSMEILQSISFEKACIDLQQCPRILRCLDKNLACGNLDSAKVFEEIARGIVSKLKHFEVMCSEGCSKPVERVEKSLSCLNNLTGEIKNFNSKINEQVKRICNLISTHEKCRDDYMSTCGALNETKSSLNMNVKLIDRVCKAHNIKKNNVKPEDPDKPNSQYKPLPNAQKFCAHETMKIECKSGESIYIQGAHFGRMRKGSCVTSNGSVGCYTDITALIRQRCLNKRRCDLEVSTLIHEIKDAECPKHLTSYLEISYQCEVGHRVHTSPMTQPPQVESSTTSNPSTKPSKTYQPIAGARQVCALETWKVFCPIGERIEVLTAHYGRMRIGKCISLDLGVLGCFNEVTELLSEKCDGKRHCEVPVDDVRDKVKNPRCPKDVTMYLEVHHKCMEGGPIFRESTPSTMPTTTPTIPSTTTKERTKAPIISTTSKPVSTYEPLNDYVEACWGTKLVASCPYGKQVIMRGGRLGRMRTGSCIPTNQAYIGCFDNVHPSLSSKCDGKRICIVDVVTLRIDIKNVIQSKCSSEYSVYLEASYLCAAGGPTTSLPQPSTTVKTSTVTMPPTTLSTTVSTSTAAVTNSYVAPADARAYCMSEEFKGYCSAGYKVKITFAHFGRMRLSKCLDKNYGHMPCYVDVKGEVGYLCGNGMTCSVPLMKLKNLLNGQTNCPSDLESYLEVTYKCVEGGVVNVPKETPPSTISTTVKMTTTQMPTTTTAVRTTTEEPTTKRQADYVPLQDAKQFCFGSTFEPSCEQNSKIIIRRAHYGRMRRGNCISELENNVGCYTDVTEVIKADCENMKTCSKSLIDLMSLETNCPSGVIGYLEVSYYCQSDLMPTTTVASTLPSGTPANSAVNIDGFEESCNFEAFTKTCQDNEKVVIKKALYGRMKLGKCIKNDLGFMPCYRDVTSVIQNACGADTSSCNIIPFYMIINQQSNNCSMSVVSHLYIDAICSPKMETTTNQEITTEVMADAGELKSFCGNEQFSYKCEDGYEMKIHEAFWGRMELGKCVTKDMGSLGCKKNVTDYVRDICSSTPQECSFWQHRLYQKTSTPCPVNLLSYLQARVECVMKPTNNPTTQGITTLAPITNGKSICFGQQHTQKCSPGQTVKIHKAYWGLMRVGECVKHDSPHVGCHTDVTSELQELCSGNECTFSSMAMYAISSVTNNCPSDYAPHLEVGISCE
ncbi:DgyrCDS8624 [Dimorphilus gyrociliatus]|uniref:DgyrCDS8624 n=1 Tax=Dimorphilus gyrociliatus TaxID=2664684 RepID=A0A7I8VUR8_9ANNE|nr:DgyrCDS8624 [Dimorphilus gyrociliatus]